MTKKETWLHKIAASIMRITRWIYEGAQSRSETLDPPGKGTTLSHPDKALRSQMCNDDTQLRRWGDAE